ncbi:hypothetical protein Pmani_023699 [Petrolisthes manimaculis]|uniref:Aminopeptidase n=1 Tax=Petrolisthes manimaculis TaxID=1843537 RepID=A0AAE1P913_9EUCA|nr:hypothetical protein Pmani_023699 [Petrolisthes manimaculis]
MPGSANSRQVLTMEMSDSAASVSFGKKHGCYVNRVGTILLALLFVSAVVATGLLVYYYAPRIREAAYISSHEYTPRDSTTVAVAGVGGAGGGGGGGGGPKKKPDVRLPRSLIPLSYVVKLQPYVNGNFKIVGSVEVEMKVMEETDKVTLHITAIKTKNHTVKVTPSDNRSGPGLKINKHEYDQEREFYIAHLDQKLRKGRTYVLYMDFDAYLNNELRGFYRSSYKDTDGNERWVGVTQFQPTDARRAFPCFDEPALKATYEIYLGRETSMTAISNMPKVATKPIDGQPGWVWDHFNTSVPMSTYLVAFAICDFEKMETQTKNDVQFRVWARSEAISQADYAFKTGPPILTFFEDYFSLPYPLPKQDMIALTDFAAGAMENWGLITYRETAMLYDPRISSASNKQRVAVIVSHELAHQWFGNLVTPSWWTDLWLNEGFASYLEYLGVNHAEPTWKMMEQFVTIDLQNVFGLDCLESSHPISIPVNHPDEINEIFDRISYSKGASVIRMMSHFLTEATFRKGLTNYLKDFAYQSAEQDDLWRYLTNAAHEDGTLPRDVTIKTIMDTWTLQMGYPVIKVTRSNQGTSANVTQDRFLLTKKSSGEGHKYRWWVPITFTGQNNPDFEATQPELWMKSTDQATVSSLPTRDQWVVFNLQETGYYRVNYDENNWNLLVQQLNTDHRVIHVINRAQIIDDAFNLARADQLSYRTALSLITYLAKEESYTPIKSTLTALSYLDSMLKRTSSYGAFKKFVLKFIIPLYNSVGFKDNVDDPHLEQFKRVLAISWACKFDHPDCVSQSTSLYKLWMENPTNDSIIQPNVRYVVYCNAIANGGEEEWNFAWEKFLSSNVAAEKTKLLNALGCTKKIWILSRYLEIAFKEGSGIRKQDAGYVFGSVARNDVGHDMAWSYLRNNWPHILEYYGSGIFTLPRLILSITKDLNTQEYLQEIKRFREENADSLATAKRSVDQGLERTVNNVAWTDTYVPIVQQWLQDQGYFSELNTV